MAQFIKLNRDLGSHLENEVGEIKTEAPNSYVVIFVTNSAEELEVSKNDCNLIDINKIGDQEDYKICNVCSRYLPTDNFAKNQNGKNNRTVRRPSCKECRVNIDGKNIPGKEKKKWENQKPYAEVWTCPICGKTTIPGVTSKLALDHNHKTGHVREWICDSCNTGLGRFKDDRQILERAIEYLNKYKN